MSVYTPDRWVVIEITRPGKEPLQKVLAGWYGGYAKGDSWQLNSGIEHVVETDNCYEFYGYSGSIYKCYKVNHGMSSYMCSVYESFQKDARSVPDCSIKLVETYTRKLG